jgi:hypothetical protein
MQAGCGGSVVTQLNSMISVYVLSLSEERWHLISALGGQLEMCAEPRNERLVLKVLSR